MKTQNMTTSLILFLFPLLLPYISLANEEPKRTPNCSVFQCGNIGITGFPFSSVTYPECGLYALDCYGETPLVKLEERWYQVTSIFYNNRKIVLRDPLLQDHLNSRNCSLNYDFTLPAFSPSISFVSKITTLTLYKCTADHPVSLSSSEFYNYTSCKDNYVLYYDYPSQLPSTLNENDTSYCSVIQLPLIERLLSQDYVRRDNLFDLLTADLSLEWNVSEDCFNCYSGKGQCITNKARQFECDKWENSTKLIINGGAKSNIKMKLQIGIGVGGTLVTVVLFILVIFQFRKIPSWKKENNNDQNLDFFFRNNGSFAPKRYRYMEVDKMTDSFKEKLGQGGCGSVFKGQLQDGRLVAVKVLFVKSTVNSGEAFLNEVASISRTSHINIVSLLGFCYEKDKRALIYEFMPNGSLDKFIYKKDILLQSSLEWEMLYQISIGIARGLGYLHRGCTTRIIHFDIKPHNILLDEDFSPKISDFGLAKLCPGKESIISMLDARGTIGYIAPEVFSRNFGGVSHKSDVYSYGMMVLEMVGGRKNFDVKVGKDHSSQLYFPDWIYDRLDQEEGLGLHGIMTEQKEEAAAKKMIIVGLWCIQINPSTRPSMSKVLEMLEGSLEALEIPPKPFLSSPARSSPSSTGSSILHDIK